MKQDVLKEINKFRQTLKKTIAKGVYVCKDCLQSRFLKRFFKLHQSNFENRKCILCKRTKNSCISLSNEEFQNIVRASIRYHYDETDYNTHFGGDELWKLFFRKNVLFTSRIRNSSLAETIEYLLCKKTSLKKPVTLYYGRTSRGIRWSFRAVKNESYGRLLDGLKSHLMKRNYFTLKRKYRWIADDIKPLGAQLEKGKVFLRGRIGNDFEKVRLIKEENFFVVKKVPYKKSKLFPSAPYKAKAGRFNRASVSYFYLANKLDTVVAELKSHIGHCVSLGRFKLNRNLMIVDFSNLNFYDFAHSDEKIERYIFLRDLSRLFSLPVPPEARAIEYLVTQFISDMIREKGYDGIAFLSSVSNGINYVFFDLKYFKCIKVDLVKVKNIKYFYKAIRYRKLTDPDTEIDVLKEYEIAI